MLSRLLFKNRQFFSADYLKKISTLYSQKQYEQILQIQSIYNPSIDQIKQNYYRLIKKYHSDNCQNDQEKAKLYEEITKIVIKSYHAIDKRLYNNNKDIKEDTTAQDQICKELFGKKFREVKYWMYEKGNQKAKDQFFDRLFKKTGKAHRTTDRSFYPDFNQQATTAQQSTTQSQSQNQSKTVQKSYNTSSESDSNVKGLAIAGIFTLFGIFLYSSRKTYQPSTKRPQASSNSLPQKYSAEEIKKIQTKRNKVVQQKADIMIKAIIKDHPPSLSFPSHGPQPHLMKQLTEYSISPDIRLYEVLPDHYKPDQKTKIVKQGLSKQNLLHLTRIKPNTTLTLSLEAERALQNIYIKVKDVITEINEKGKFTPPQVFLRFHGFVMFQIRQKPLSLRNYRDTDYISLFDLFFDYYSPIFLKKDRFSQYLVGKDQIQYFGWVHLNNKKCNPVYININDKAVYFHSDREKQTDKVYQKIWQNFYRVYQDRWREGGNTKQRCGI